MTSFFQWLNSLPPSVDIVLIVAVIAVVVLEVGALRRSVPHDRRSQGGRGCLTDI